MKYLESSLIKFALAGVVNTLVDYCAYFFIVYSIYDGGSQEIAKGVGAVLGITSAYILNSLWVFRQNFMQELYLRTSIRHKGTYIALSYSKMFLTYSIGMALNIFIFSKLHASGNFPEIVCLVAATGVSMIFNFVFTKKLVYATRVNT